MLATPDRWPMSLTQLQAALTDRGLSAAEARLVVETGRSEGRIYVLHCQGVQADVYAVAGETCSDERLYPFMSPAEQVRLRLPDLQPVFGLDVLTLFSETPRSLADLLVRRGLIVEVESGVFRAATRTDQKSRTDQK